MNLLRTHDQATLQDTLITCKESLIHLRDATEFITREDISSRLETLAGRRQIFVDRLTTALRQLGDLPADTDPDKETVEKALNRLHAAATTEQPQADFLRQRILSEEKFLHTIQQHLQTGLNELSHQLLTMLSDELRHSLATLKSMHHDLANTEPADHAH